METTRQVRERLAANEQNASQNDSALRRKRGTHNDPREAGGLHYGLDFRRDVALERRIDFLVENARADSRQSPAPLPHLLSCFANGIIAAVGAENDDLRVARNGSPKVR
jgi:hypothetical protein